MISFPSYKYDSYLHFLLEPNQNGFLAFLMGGLFILSIYHSILYIQSKDKSYFYYALYTALIFITYSSLNPNSFLGYLLKDYNEFLSNYKLMFIWIYNSVYFSFGVTFINLKEHNYKWYKVILTGVYSLLLIGILTQIVSYILGDPSLFKKAYVFCFLPIISGFSLVSFWIILKVPSNLKYYLFIGSLFLFLSSLLATFIMDVGIIDGIYNLGIFIFYIGLIVENIFFSIGLGYKQHLILIEKNNVLSELLEGAKQNQNLKKQLNDELNEKVKILEAKIKSDKENNELKLTVFKNKISPHFIFNSLNTLKFLIVKKDLHKAITYLTKFSKLLRSVLEKSIKTNISLQEELDFLDLYIFLENLRFKEPITYTCIIDKSIDEDKVSLPSLILQPILENSILHGLTPKIGEKSIEINIKRINSKKIEISIEDNGVGRSFSKEKNNQNSFGIKLTQERLYAFDKNASFTITDLIDDSNNPLGTKTSIAFHTLVAV